MDKISPIEPVTRIPFHHLKWCGQLPKKKEPKKKKPEIKSGDLILYDRLGQKKIHSFTPQDEK